MSQTLESNFQWRSEMTHVSNLRARLKRVSSSGAAYLAVTVLAGLSMVSGAVAQQAAQEVSQEPLYLGGGGVPGNLVLTPSVEYPTIQSLANLGNYSALTRFEGYFDPDKCYEYVKGNNESGNHFKPKRVQTTRNCTQAKEWSGNFLNWAVTQTIDPFRKVLTGGYRVRDTASDTWLEKARHPGQSSVTIKELSGSDAVKAATPFDSSKIKIKIQGLGKDMRFSLGTTSVDADERQYDGGTSLENNKSYRAAVRVKVCDASVGVEDNCKQYSQGWKPEGLLQQNADRIRYSVFGYLNQDGSGRDGGVLRARQKYIGPKMFAGSEGFIDNPNKEWDPATGVLDENPDKTDAAANPRPVSNSGVINYINKFGQLNSHDHKSNDPVSELYYAATRYLKNQGNVSSYSSFSNVSDSNIDKYKDGFPVIATWDDPIQYACQPNVILGIGDANTHDDGNLPGSEYRGDEPSEPQAVKNDTTVNVATMTNKVGQLQGLGNNLGEKEFTGRENTAYIAGLAFHNLTVDMRSDLAGKQTASTHWVDVMEGGVLELPAKNQYYLATKYGGFKVPDGFDPETRTEPLEESWWHTNGESLQGWDKSFFKRPDNFYIAGQADKMIESLREAFHNISNELSSSSSSIAANSTSLENETAIYQASFNSSRWSGELVAYALDGITISEKPFWKAAEVLDDEDRDMDDRTILTAAPLAEVTTGSGVYLTGTGAEFTWDVGGLTADQKLLLALTDNPNSPVEDSVAQDRLNYLRGDRSNEQTAEITSRPFRQRGSRLGDIINSSPVYVHQQNFGYFRLHMQPGYTGMDESTYETFRDSDTYKDRPPFLLVGANDGMLHAFNASVTVGEGGGEELFAYVPSSIIGDLWRLTEPDYVHRYYVDASPVVSDAWLGATLGWRTLAVGTTGAGGRSVFALDVTDPEDMTTSSVLWEFTHDEMGFTMQKPGIFALANGQFGVAVSSGYGRDAFLDANDAALNTGKVWFLDAATGSIIKEITIPTGGAELGSPLLIDINADRIADRMYVADTAGKVWRVDINNTNTANWQAPAGLLSGTDMLPLFEAAMPGANDSDAAVPQPVTADLTAAMNEYGGIMVFFGTGSFQNVGDNIVGNPAAVQSFYGIIDRGVPVARGSLLEQKVLDEVVNAQGNRLRLVSTNKPPTPHYGWYMDLVVAKENAKPEGERVVSQALVRSDRLIFPTLIPSADPCASGGRSWLMEVDLYSGGRLDYEVFDTDNDGDIDEQDRIPGGDDEGNVPPSGIDPDIGIIQKPTIIENCKDGDECKIVSGSSGQAEVIQEKGIQPVGRIRWEQLR
jgi:type IV pilus assembly protein PilY1